MSTVKKLESKHEVAEIFYKDKSLQAPIIGSTDGDYALDISKLRDELGVITLDEGFVNTGSCQSKITFLDGDLGILRYRGYPIEQLAEQNDFLEVAYLLIYGELPDSSNKNKFIDGLASHKKLNKSIESFISLFPKTAHPMSVLATTLSAYSGIFPEYDVADPSDELKNKMISHALGDMKTIAAAIFRHSIGQKSIDSNFPKLNYAADFINMLGQNSSNETAAKALNLLLVLHADHEQNCSTSAVRLVGSSKANLFSSLSSGVNALWGPLHGGANQAVIEMLEDIHKAGGDYKKFLARAKDKNDTFRLMGFGHRVYKNFDPRAKIIKVACDELLALKGIASDPLLDIAKGLEASALSDSYFVERKLYPNVDFYSGIMYRALGIPTEMFTVMFALGRLPGWLAQWKEMRESKGTKIGRPRQVYIGEGLRKTKS